jgi:hypothetical protein
MDGIDDVAGVASDVGGTFAGGSGDAVGRVLSVPGRSATAVLAAAAVVVAAALFLLQVVPSGSVSADAPVGRDASAGAVDGTGSTHPDEASSSSVPTSTRPRPVIGLATAEGVSRFQSSGGRAGGAERQSRPASSSRATPATTGAAATSTPSPSRAGPSRPGPRGTSTPTSTRPTSTVTLPTAVGAVTRLTLTPSDRGYLAHLEVPTGWLITSVRDVHGARVLEHLSRSVEQFDGRMHGGELVVEVRRVRPGLTGDLVALFTDRSGVALPGSGSYRLR